MIDEWFDENGGVLDSVENRMSRLINLFNHLKNNGISEIDEEMAGKILERVSKGPDTNLVLLEIFHIKEMIFDSRTVESKLEPIKTISDKEKVCTKKEWSQNDDYDEEDAKPKLHINKSELKTKEFDMEVLNELGLNIEDLHNE